MPRTAYIEKNMSEERRQIVGVANRIIAAYQAEGYRLTLRQLYYQFVSRDLIENTNRSYKRLGAIINDGRLLGLIDWDAIEDRTRNVSSPPHWDNPAAIIEMSARAYRIDKWEEQKYRPEVWVEKEALAGVIEPVCRRLDVSFLSCRGYTSQSEMWAAGQRLIDTAKRHGQKPVVIHLGDHDPSGIDMTRDIRERLELFTGGIEVRRIALTMDQVEKHKPPPNPAKQTDARFKSYLDRYGDESWELDALEPALIDRLITETVESYLDFSVWEEFEQLELRQRELLGRVSERWEEVERVINK